MPYYHVTIGSISGWPYDENVYNFDWERLQSRILAPRSEGSAITINGKTISISAVARIVIRSTEQPLDTSDDRWTKMLLKNLAEDVTDEFITGPPGSRTTVGNNHAFDTGPSIDAQEVFVVHGRNIPARNAMFDFLRALGLHPLEWQELMAQTRQGSPYIGSILDLAFSRAHALVVLMTPDDEARLSEPFRNLNEPDEEKLQGQPRPNVLFEAGMAFGRNEARTILVEMGELRAFSDVAGRHTIRFDGSAERRHELAQRLKSSGCPVNTDGSDWLTAGDFAAAIELATAVDPGEGVEIRKRQEATTADGGLQISSDAAELLAGAAEDGDARIIKVVLMGSTVILSGPRTFTTIGDRRSEARWVSALDELVYHDLAQFAGGEAYDVTHQGFVVADSFKANQ